MLDYIHKHHKKNPYDTCLVKEYADGTTINRHSQQCHAALTDSSGVLKNESGPVTRIYSNVIIPHGEFTEDVKPLIRHVLDTVFDPHRSPLRQVTQQTEVIRDKNGMPNAFVIDVGDLRSQQVAGLCILSRVNVESGPRFARTFNTFFEMGFNSSDALLLAHYFRVGSMGTIIGAQCGNHHVLSCASGGGARNSIYRWQNADHWFERTTLMKYDQPYWGVQSMWKSKKKDPQTKEAIDYSELPPFEPKYTGVFPKLYQYHSNKMFSRRGFDLDKSCEVLAKKMGY